RKRNDQHQAPGCTLLIFKLSAIHNGISCRKHYFTFDLAPHLRDKASQIASGATVPPVSDCFCATRVFIAGARLSHASFSLMASVGASGKVPPKYGCSSSKLPYHPSLSPA